MYILKNLLVSVNSDIPLIHPVAKKLGVNPDRINIVKILRQSLDARHKNRLKFNYTLQLQIDHYKIEHKDLSSYIPDNPGIETSKIIDDPHPFIIGAGPAGLFAAIALTEKGFKPFVFEMGSPIEERTKQVSDFWKSGTLDPESNVQFGEGGAGAFSDGKLTSRNRNFYSAKVFDYLIKFGAPPEISYQALPHIGTDKLYSLILNIRRYLLERGCTIKFNHKLKSIRTRGNRVSEVTINNIKYSPEILILACGNSALNTYLMLSKKTTVSNKPFAVGVRVEHSQEFLNHSLYGQHNNFEVTGPATYRLTYKYKNRGIYSFCMCPGGHIICGSTKENTTVTNGMSYHSRSGRFGNSAIVVTIGPEEYGGGQFAGFSYQQMIEKKCYNIHTPFNIPTQNIRSFLNNKTGPKIKKNSLLPGGVTSNLNNFLPKAIIEPLSSALIHFDRTLIPGFISQGIIAAPETRTSCPVTILRDSQSLHSSDLINLYPVGEGSGYAGGIISSAADGYRTGSIFTSG